MLHAFRGSPDGASPATPLVADSKGNLFGTTISGGVVNNIGTVFELSPNGSGGYTYSQIYAFKYGVGDAEVPGGPLVIDSAGNLYGTAQYGGLQGGVGAVFELSPVPGGGWSEKVIYSFLFGTGDGFYPTGMAELTASGRYSSYRRTRAWATCTAPPTWVAGTWTAPFSS